MRNKKSVSAKRGTRLITSLILVVALMASLFAVVAGSAAEDKKYDYTVTFDANGGVFDAKDDNGKTQTKINRGGWKDKGGLYGNGGLEDWSGLGVTREGYEFEGWSALADASKVNVEPDKYNPKQNVTVKAVWYKLIDVAFDDQQGNVTHIYVDKAADDNSKTLSLKDIPEPDDKDGKVFAGWYTDKACTTEAINYAVQIPNEDVTYYAGYSDGATVQLIGNGGHYRVYAKGETSKIGEYEYHINKTVHYQKGTTLATKADPAGPELARGETLDAYGNIQGEADRFVGYYTDKNFDPATKVDFDDAITKDMTLYARWDDGDYYYVTYKYYDAAAKEWKDYQYKTVMIGDPLTGEQKIANPTDLVDKDGKPVAFVGWYTDKALTKEAPKFNGTYTPEDDITLYAKTSNYVDVKLNYWYSNDNKSDPMFIDSIELSYVAGSKLDYEDEFTNRMLSDEELQDLGINPQESGISTTWYTDRAHTKVFTTVDGLKGEVNIYGAKIGRQELTLNTTAKGSYILPGDENTQKLTIYVNKDATLKEASDPYWVDGFESTAKAPKVFYGWSLTSGSMKAVSDEEVGRTRNLYAIIGDAYTITFDMNGGYTTDYELPEGARRATSITRTVPMNTTVPEVINSIPHYYYGDKTFQGWSTDADGKYMIDPKTFTVSANTTLYAQWARYGEDTEPVDPTDTKIYVKVVDGKQIAVRGKKSTTKADDYTGIAPEFDNSKVWWRVVKGDVVPDATGVFKNEYGWWRVEQGTVNFNAQGIYKNEYGWWKTTNGKVTFNETGVFKNEYGWWRVEKSKVNFKANGIYKNQYGWWKTTNGKVTFKENGVFKNEYGWWKVENSKVNFKFNGIAKNEYGTWFLENGKVNFKYSGKVVYNKHTYQVTNGKAKLVK